MFPAATRMGGQCFAFPDVCIIPPAPPKPPTPAPFPNTAMCPMALPFTCSLIVKILNQPVLLQTSVIPRSDGDQPGANGGVTSGMIMGPVQYRVGSSRVKVEGMGVVTVFHPTGHNGASANAPAGAQVVPSQFTVLVAW
jgi:Domain of unknown function (DUF4150)